jgi:hypothetical protein
MFVNARVGSKSHGLVSWKNGFLILSLGESSLLHVTPEYTRVIWSDKRTTFLKGMTIKDSVLHFSLLNRTLLSTVLVALDLESETIISETEIETCGGFYKC